MTNATETTVAAADRPVLLSLEHAKKSFGGNCVLEDISLMRGLPGMNVLVPADYWAAKQAIRIAAATPGPFYVRLGRAKVPEVYDAQTTLELGKSYVLSEGTDVTVIAAGVEVAQALEAKELLAAEGISAEVIDAFSIKPFDKETLLASVKKTGCVVTCEEHSTVGGLGSAVADILGENYPVPLERVGVRDSFGTSGDPNELLAEFKLDAAGIVEKVKAVLARK